MPSNNGGKINFQVGYNVDQASVNAVKKSLQDLQNIKPKDSEYIHKDSFDKIFSLQKLIHKQAGLKQLCKIIIH